MELESKLTANYFFGVLTCFGFLFSRPRLSLLISVVCHDPGGCGKPEFHVVVSEFQPDPAAIAVFEVVEEVWTAPPDF